MPALARRTDQPEATNGSRSGRLRRNRRASPAGSGWDPSLGTLTAGALYDLAREGVDFPGKRALLGAALDVRSNNAMDVRRLVQPWQARSMGYFDLVPEHKFAARFMGALLRQVRLFPALIDPDTGEPEEQTDGPVYEAFQRIKDTAGGMALLQQSYGTLKYLIGEGYLTVSPDEQYGEVWEFLSPNELRVQPGGVATRFRAPMLSADQYQIGQIETRYVVGNAPETIAREGRALEPGFGDPIGPAFAERGPDVIVVYRIWRPHPAYSWLADSNTMASLDLLEELVLSTYSVRAQLKNRLYQAGVLAMPTEMSFLSTGDDPDEDPNSDLFEARLNEAITTAIGDPGSAAALSPLVVQMAGEFIKDVKFIRFNDNQGELAEISQRAEMVERYGVGAELPPELFSSKQDMNHWTGWLVSEDVWKSYGHPAALEMAEDVNAAYLRKAMFEQNFADWERVCIGIDPAEVINHPNRSQDATLLYQARAISKSVYREALGYNDNDAPPEDELNEMIGVAIRDGSYAAYGIPAVRANIEPEAGEVEGAPDGQDGAANPATGGQNPPGAPVSKKPGEPGSEQEPKPPKGGAGSDATSGGPAVTAAALEHRILGAAEFAIQRGRELAGSRLRSMTGKRGVKCDDCLAVIDGAANARVPALLGETRVVELFGPCTPTLVDGTGHAFATVLEQMGVTRAWAAELGAMVEVHTAGTLYQETPRPLPAAFQRVLARIDTEVSQ